MKFSGQGPVSLAYLDANGIPGPFFSIGCTDELPFKFNVEKWEHAETCSGQYGIDATGIKKKSGEFSLKLTEFNSKNWALATNGTYVPTATASVTNEIMPTGLVNGDIYAAKHFALTSVTIADSTPTTPLVPALNTNYTVDAELGTITWVSVAGFIQPFKVNYTYTDPGYVAFLTQGIRYMALRYEYLNMQNNGARGLVELYKVGIDPANDFELINPELQIAAMDGTMLIDTTKSSSGPLGQFGRATGVPI